MPSKWCFRVNGGDSRHWCQEHEIMQQHTLETLGSVDCRAPGTGSGREPTKPSLSTVAMVCYRRNMSITVLRLHAAATHRTCRHDRAQVGQSDIGEDAYEAICAHGNCNRVSALARLPCALAETSRGLVDVGATMSSHGANKMFVTGHKITPLFITEGD